MPSSMAHTLKLKPMPTNIRNSNSQSMDAYLREIKKIVDSLVDVNSPTPSSNFVHYIFLGFGWECENFVTTLTHVLMHLTFDYLHPRLLL